jgi:leader peptidase (prepilin peptidase) / N-methyltransferase
MLGNVTGRSAVLALAALAGAAVVVVRGVDDDLVLELPFVAGLVLLAAIDLERRVLPNRIVYPLALWGVVATALLSSGDLPEHLGAGAGAFALLLAVALLHPPGMGLGDVKLAGAMGLCLGLAVIPALLVAFLAGSLAGLVLVLREGTAAGKATLPFGVFLALGGIAGVLAGPELIDLYDDAFLA